MTANLAIRLPRLHAAQQRVIDGARRFNVVCCGRRWGKSVLAIDRLIWPALQGQPSGYFAPTYKLLSEPWRDVLRMLYPAHRKITVQEHRVELVTGGVIDFWSLDSGEAGRGRRYRQIVVDEAAMVSDLSEVWQGSLRPTLADLEGEAWFFSTPRGHDAFYALWEYGQDDTRPDWASWQLPTSTNPHIPADEIAAARTSMDARFYAQEFEASFEDMAGRVYHRFDRALNVRDDLVDTGGELLVGMDFNVNPMSACVAVRAADELHVIDEVELRDSNTREMCEAIRARYPGRTITVYPDPSGSARKTSAPVGQTDFAIIRAAGFGLKAPAAAPNVVDRINEVNALCCNAEGRRRLLVHPRCRSVIRSLAELTYLDGKTMVDKRSGLDHEADALGYLCHVEFPLVRHTVEQVSGGW